MNVRTERFREGAREALKDSRLQGAIANATGRFMKLRDEAFRSFPPGEAMRDLARAVKEHTLAELDRYLAQLADSVWERGGEVHWAADAAEACGIVRAIAQDEGARLVVKSKSMTTEEIGLNEALEGAGIETVETDLGEYIIQLAGETPSHIIAPAIHKTKEDVADLFAKHLGGPRLDRHEDLTLQARSSLREKFIRADIGVSGVNFAVAETGTIVIVENEGNARLSTSLPRVHIAVMGMEKVIPDLGALAVFLKILARSATGQNMSSYVSMVTGPRRPGEEDGPERFHLVVLDNGRSRLLADPHLRESLYCIRCGACLNACPVYRHVGGHAYGWVYSGPIGAVVTPSLVGHARAKDLPFASSLCGACRDVCPVRIDIPGLLLEQRRAVVAGQGTPRTKSRTDAEGLVVRLFTHLMSTEKRYRWASRLAYWGSLAFARQGRISRMPFLNSWTRSRDFPAPARRTFREIWSSPDRAASTDGKR